MSAAVPVSVHFADGKDPEAMRTIGEVASAIGVKTHILRYWEDQFPKLQPLKRSGGRRLYRPEDVALVASINRLVNSEGYTLKGALRTLEEREAEKRASVDSGSNLSTPMSDPARVVSYDAQLVRRLQVVRSRLAAALLA